MKFIALTLGTLITPDSSLLRFPCAQLVVDRLDPWQLLLKAITVVTPGQIPSPHLHQIVRGTSFNGTMDPEKDMPTEYTCTTCQFSEDFSDYRTAVLYFKARNGTYKRMSQIQNVGLDGVEGGMTVYYMQDGLYNFNQTSKVAAFQTVSYEHQAMTNVILTTRGPGVSNVYWKCECAISRRDGVFPPSYLYLTPD
ncbi:hypothetical protein ANO14919_086050 [Xylariales sp. No.14919]|nr:hypothetical protein ANO14919_086050 [Xylariales sp. No.14919]